jgi:hypothetical protein
MARKTDEFNKDVIELRMELAKMRATVTALEERVSILERDLVAARGAKAAPAAPTSMPGGIPRPGAAALKKSSKGPPPIPGMPATMPALPKTMSKHPGKRSYIDISDVAELVDSVPPPPTRGSRR